MQAYALELMLMMEARDKARDFGDRLKLALVSADPKTWMKVAFPEALQAAEEDKVVKLATEEDLIDTSGKEWKFTDNVDPEDALEIMALLNGAAQVTVTAQDLGLGDEEGWL